MNRLKEIRKQKGLTQQELGRIVDKYPSYVSLVETGRYRPWMSEKEALARALGVQVSDIFPDKS